jgi:dihydrofolate reductase
VSSTLEHPAWNNSTVLKGDPLNEVPALKEELTGEIIVPASFGLVRTLMEHDRVDELRLKIFPVVLGATRSSDVLAAGRRHNRSHALGSPGHGGAGQTAPIR